MGRRITITCGQVRAQAELNDSATAGEIIAALPIEAVACTWGDEVYFDIGVRCPLDRDAREQVAVGECGYWPDGRAFCIFFGPTPASGPDGKPLAADKVNPLGSVIGDAGVFKTVRDGQKITLSAE
jgi:uncharacterized protein